MKIILLKDVKNIGKAWDVVDVSDGYARNFLMPKRLAQLATTGEVEKLQKQQKEYLEKSVRLQEKQESLKLKFLNRTFTVNAKANDQTLFAAIHEKTIADSINQKLSLEITPEQIILNQPIKNLGLTTAQLKLSPNVLVNIKINVEAL